MYLNNLLLVFIVGICPHREVFCSVIVRTSLVPNTFAEEVYNVSSSNGTFSLMPSSTIVLPHDGEWLNGRETVSLSNTMDELHLTATSLAYTHGTDHFTNLHLKRSPNNTPTMNIQLNISHGPVLNGHKSNLSQNLYYITDKSVNPTQSLHGSNSNTKSASEMYANNTPAMNKSNLSQNLYYITDKYVNPTQSLHGSINNTKSASEIYANNTPTMNIELSVLHGPFVDKRISNFSRSLNSVTGKYVDPTKSFHGDNRSKSLLNRTYVSTVISYNYSTKYFPISSPSYTKTSYWFTSETVSFINTSDSENLLVTTATSVPYSSAAYESFSSTPALYSQYIATGTNPNPVANNVTKPYRHTAIKTSTLKIDRATSTGFSTRAHHVSAIETTVELWAIVVAVVGGLAVLGILIAAFIIFFKCTVTKRHTFRYSCRKEEELAERKWPPILASYSDLNIDCKIIENEDRKDSFTTFKSPEERVTLLVLQTNV